MKKLVALVVMLAMLLLSTTVAFASPDPNITIVNPANSTTVTSGSLLISVKIAKKQTVRVSLHKNNGTDSNPAWQAIFTNASFTSKNNLSFYTRKAENISPGKYRVKVDTIRSDGNPIYVTYSNVTIKENVEADDKAAYNGTGGTATFLQSLLKSIFGN
ncbi:MAG: hypothetical protein PHW03_06270 [Eubacteriales bacterium]|nr:hypothetical protein [Eubacteriales bacterium]MDD4390393.1 hypothetical protein [Eubacteriales bacterium]